MDKMNGQSDTALREELGILGLSDTEIDTYLALLSHGEATTRVIAEDADVTQRSVYSIAERLEERGLVRVKEHASPTMISALPPEEAIGDLSTRLESITSELGERFNKATSEAPEVNIVKSPETALNRMQTLLREAKKEVWVAIPEEKYPEIEADLRNAKERGLLVFLVLGEATAPESANEATSRFATVADVVRTWEAGLPFVCVADGNAAIIGDPNFLAGPHGDKEAVSVTQRHLTGAINGMCFLSLIHI